MVGIGVGGGGVGLSVVVDDGVVVSGVVDGVVSGVGVAVVGFDSAFDTVPSLAPLFNNCGSDEQGW